MAVMAWTRQRILRVNNVAPGSVTIRHDVEYSVSLLHSNDVISAPRGSDEMVTQLLLVFALHRRLRTQTLHTQTHNNRRSTNTAHCYTHTHNRFTALFPGPSGWAGARRELLDFMVQGNINTGRHTDHPAGRHSIRTNQCPSPPSPIFFTGRMPFLPFNQHRQSTEGMYHANC